MDSLANSRQTDHRITFPCHGRIYKGPLRREPMTAPGGSGSGLIQHKFEAWTRPPGSLFAHHLNREVESDLKRGKRAR
jgi:hypothetical protein